MAKDDTHFARLQLLLEEAVQHQGNTLGRGDAIPFLEEAQRVVSRLGHGSDQVEAASLVADTLQSLALAEKVARQGYTSQAFTLGKLSLSNLLRKKSLLG